MTKPRTEKKLKSLYKFDWGLQRFPKDIPEKLFVEPPRGNIYERFAMYGKGFGIRSRESMEEMFGVFHKQIGKSEWLSAGRAYFKKFPSNSYNLINIGKNFPKFLKQKGYAQKWIDLANLELLVADSFDAYEEKSQINSDVLKKISEKTRFYFQPSVHLFQSDWQCAAAWIGRNHEEPFIRGAEYSITFRKDYIGYVGILEKTEFEVLLALKSGLNFERALSKASDEIIPDKLSLWLHNWFQNNYFYQLKV